MSYYQRNYGKLVPEETTRANSIYSDKQLVRVDYSMDSLTSISFVASVAARDITISIISTDVAGDISLYQSLDGINYSEIVSDGLPIAASAIGGIDSDIINLSGIAQSFLKIVYDKTAEGTDPYVAVLCIGTGV